MPKNEFAFPFNEKLTGATFIDFGIPLNGCVLVNFPADFAVPEVTHDSTR